MANLDMRELARMGAQARLTELQTEINNIYAAFPDLRTQGTGGGRRRGRPRKSETQAAAANDGAGAAAKQGRKRRPRSAASRKAQSERMKKYWAARRRAEAKG